jgi:membrane dipeptidase
MNDEQARALYRDALVWDMTLPWTAGYSDDETLPRFHRAGIKVLSLTLDADQDFTPNGFLIQHGHVLRQCRIHPELALATTVEEIEAAVAAGRMALILHLQGTNALGRRLELVEVFYRLGIRHMLLAYNQKNMVGDGCAERTDGGLSRYGISLIREMNRVGMLVDGTHTGYRTTMEAMEVCEGPFIFSHANAYGVHAHYRNIKDDQIKACAATGGMIGINGLGWFLRDLDAKPESMFRHIDYMVNLVGPRHVGIGLDFVKNWDAWSRGIQTRPDQWPPNEGETPPITKFVQPEQLEDLAVLMARAGYGEEDMRDILGRNFLRVSRQVWKPV